MPEGLDDRLGVDPIAGGYEGRDPKTEMPRVPSVPETADDPEARDGEPSDSGDRPDSG